MYIGCNIFSNLIKFSYQHIWICQILKYQFPIFMYHINDFLNCHWNTNQEI